MGGLDDFRMIGFVLACLLACGCSAVDESLLKRDTVLDRGRPDAGADAAAEVDAAAAAEAGVDAATEAGALEGGVEDSGAAGTGGSGAGGDSGATPDAGPFVSDAGDGGGLDGGDASKPWLGWERALTFDALQVDADLTAFPVLVRLTDSELAANAAQDGSDIHFVDEAHTTTLAHEIESYDGTVGSLLAWVRLPTLTAATDTVIYLRYGDGGPDRSDPATLWSDHHYVWHLAQNPGPGVSGDIRDSTGRAHGTASSTMADTDLVDAVVGKGIDFDGVDDEITFVNDFTGAASSTVSAWVNQLTDNDGVSDTVVSFGSPMTGQTRFLYSSQTTTNTVVGGFYSNEVDSGHSIEGMGWRHIAWVWDGSASFFYVNGVLVRGPVAHSGADAMGSAGKIGNATWNPRFLRGQLDELRFSSTTRSAAWIKAEYENQRSGSTFLKAVGAQQTVAAP
jgi:trimeric autotransporter adhesin